jgi:urease accessory protein
MSNDSSSTTAIAIDRKLDRHHPSSSPLLLWLTAEERTRSRHHFIAADGTPVSLQLPRGTVLVDGDLLGSETDIVVRVAAKPEPVLTVTSDDAIDLLRAAYHLGNRHVSLEIAPTYLRLTPDSVLERMLVQLGGLQVVAETAPFSPQGGAYSHQH